MSSEAIKLHPAQSEIARDRHRFRVINCGRRFGKTLLSVWEMYAFAVAKDNGRVAYVAPTYQQARDIAWNELKKVCQPVLLNTNEQRLEVIIKNKFGGTSTIVLRGWESVEGLRGQAFHFLVLDEVAMYRNFWLMWQEVLRPTLTDHKGHAMFISTPRGFNHFYDIYNLQAEDADYTSFHFTTTDNPYIPKDEVEKAKEELTEDRFAQEYMADFRKMEGLVYKEFDRDFHILKGELDEDDVNTVKVMAGVDPGFKNPAAVLTIWKTGAGKYVIPEEWYKTGKTDAAIADYVAGLRVNECYSDPENQGFIKELENRKVNVRDVVKGKGSVATGISVVRELLKANRILIHESCVNLIMEFEMYSYPDKKPDRPENENPIKEHDNALDALRYVLMMDSPEQPEGGVTYTEAEWISPASSSKQSSHLKR